MVDIRLIALDLDGTLFNDDRGIPEENIVALTQARQAGVRLVIATGRSLSGVKQLVEQLSLTDQDFLIVQNGAQIIRVGAYEVVGEHIIAQEAMSKLLDFGLQFDKVNAQITAYNTDNLYLIDALQPNAQVLMDADILSCQVDFLSQAQLYQRQDINKMVVLGLPETVDQIEQAISDDLRQYFSPVRSQREILEFLPQRISKASALKELTQMLDLEAVQVMAMGDQLNDLEMIEYAGVGVAMGNGHPTIKACANYITSSNNDAGVAHAIGHFLFEEK